MRHALCASILVGLVTACGGGQKETRTTGQPAAMSLQEAHSLVAALEAEQARLEGQDPLRDPKSLKDVGDILHRDELELFKHGIAFAEKDPSKEAQSLVAQIELARADAHMIMAGVFSDASIKLRASVRKIKARGLLFAPSPADKARYDQMSTAGEQCERMAEALALLAYEDLSAGAKRAQEVVAANPDDYVGYRVAADYYRLRQDWEKFDEVIAKLTALNPDSNGLRFQKGAAALQRDNNHAAALAFFEAALKADPKFARAQVFALLAHAGVEDEYQELQKLKALGPNHQMVLWAGPYITASYEAQLAAAGKTAPAAR